MRPQWRRSVTIGLMCLVLVGLGSFILIPAVRHGVGAYAFRDLGVHQARVDLTSDEELYTWARTQTPKDALFFFDSPLFRYRAQRSITHARGDLINHREPRYVEIFRRYERLEKAYKDPAELIQAAKDLQANYLVVEKSRGICLNLPLVFNNEKYLVYKLSPYIPEPVPARPTIHSGGNA